MYQRGAPQGQPRLGHTRFGGMGEMALCAQYPSCEDIDGEDAVCRCVSWRKLFCYSLATGFKKQRGSWEALF